ncbi:unnamed protein product, partial [Heterotrigona itama]
MNDLTTCWRASLKLMISITNQHKCESESSILKRRSEETTWNQNR